MNNRQVRREQIQDIESAFTDMSVIKPSCSERTLSFKAQRQHLFYINITRWSDLFDRPQDI